MPSIRYSIRPNTISTKDQQFADHYFGGSKQLLGSAKACYKHLHPRCKDSTAETEGPALLRKPQVRAYLESKAQKLREATEINAQWVLEQSIRLYHRCMGDESHPVEYTHQDKETGKLVTTVHQERSYNPQGARAALELIGRNTGIQAFKENIEVSHTHYLEQALARRAKAVEDRATRSLPVLPDHSGVDIEADQVTARDAGRGGQVGTAPGRESEAGRADLIDPVPPGHADPTGRQPGGRQKEGPSAGGQPNAGPN